MPTADVILLARWVEGRDADAFREIASQHAGMVYATCRRILRNDAEAEDVAQDCFETLARIDKAPKGYLGAWLHRVATNRALDRIKTNRHRKDREARFAEARGGQAEPAWDDIYEYVDEAIAELPDKYRVPLIAHYLEGQSHAAIALVTGVPRRTITHRIGKGIELVRKSLKKRGISVATSALMAMMAANLAEAAPLVPASLTAVLGKLAIAGATNPAAGASGATVIGGLIAMKSTVAAVAVGVLAIAVVVVVGSRLHTRATELREARTAIADFESRVEELSDENRILREQVLQPSAELEAEPSETTLVPAIAQEDTSEVEDTEEWQPPELTEQQWRVMSAKMGIVVDVAFAPFFEEYGLEPDVKAEVRDLLMQRQVEHVMATQEPWMPPGESTAREVKERQDEATERLRNELARVLNAHEMAAWEECEEYADLHFAENTTRGELISMAQGLTSENLEIAAQIIAEESEGANAEYMSSDQEFSWEALANVRAAGLERAQARLAETLDEEQYGQLESYFNLHFNIASEIGGEE